jgi:hypothetical protein
LNFLAMIFMIKKLIQLFRTQYLRSFFNIWRNKKKVVNSTEFRHSLDESFTDLHFMSRCKCM